MLFDLFDFFDLFDLYGKTSSHILRHLLMVNEDEEDDWDKIEFEDTEEYQYSIWETNTGECDNPEEQAAQHHE